MTGPAVLDTPETRLAAIRARLAANQGETPEDRLAAIQARLAANQGQAPIDQNAKLHNYKRSAAVPDATSTSALGSPAETDLYDPVVTPWDQQSLMDKTGKTALRVAGSFPFGSAITTGLRSVITGQSRANAAEQNAADAGQAAEHLYGVNIPKIVPVFGGSRVTVADIPAAAGAIKLAASALPALGPKMLAAVYGGAVRATDPRSESLGNRAWETAKAAAASAVIPAIAEVPGMVKTRIAAGRAPSYDANMIARVGAKGIGGGARAAEAGPHYDAFHLLEPLPETPRLIKMLDNPLVRKSVTRVKRESTLSDLPDTHPKVLDAAFQDIGKLAKKKGYNASETVADFGDAIEESAQQIGGSYKAAVDPFRIHSNNARAVQRGYRAMQYAAAEKGAPPGAVADSPAAFREWAKGAARTPEELQGATEGVQARLQVEPATSTLLKIPFAPSRAVRAAPGLLEATQGPGWMTRGMNTLREPVNPGNLMDYLRRNLPSTP